MYRKVITKLLQRAAVFFFGNQWAQNIRGSDRLLQTREGHRNLTFTLISSRWSSDQNLSLPAWRFLIRVLTAIFIKLLDPEDSTQPHLIWLINSTWSIVLTTLSHSITFLWTDSHNLFDPQGAINHKYCLILIHIKCLQIRKQISLNVFILIKMKIK